MASGHHDPKLLYAVEGVSAHHIAHGKESPLTPAGPQTLSLLMVPTSSAAADPAQADRVPGDAEEDFYLHLHLPPELDLPLPATTQIYHQPPTSYLIPRWDLGPDSGAFTRLEFPAAGSRAGVQEDVDTFETILAQCTAFLERAPPPKIAGGQKKTAKNGSSTRNGSSSKAREAARENLPAYSPAPAYNPADFKPGEAYARGSHSSRPVDEKHSPLSADGKRSPEPAGGQIVLINEEDGSVVGELGDGFRVVEDGALKPGSKDPVEITLPAEGGHNVEVAPASADYMEMLMHPAYKKSSLVSNATAASRLIVTTSNVVGKALQGHADSYTRKTKPAEKGVVFKPATHKHIRRIGAFTGGAAELSAMTVREIGKVAQNLGATLAGHGDKGGRGFGPDGKPVENYKPGLLNKSLMAFNTVADGIEQAGINLLGSSATAATTVVNHKWGPEAGEVSRRLGSGVTNVGVVYIDVSGVSRRAVLKSVVKGMVLGRTADGRQVVVGGGDGGEAPQDEKASDSGSDGTKVKEDEKMHPSKTW